MKPESLYLHDVFDQPFVGADLGALQPTDILTDPDDKCELGPFAHGVSCHEADEAVHALLIWRMKPIRICKNADIFNCYASQPQALWSTADQSDHVSSVGESYCKK